jgi:hypothetical protein
VIRFLLAFFLVFWTAPALAQECADKDVCVVREDLKAFIEIAKEKACLQDNKPEFELDPVNIIVDRDGRIFYSGAAPHPYKLRMKWCNYVVEAEGKVNVLAAVQEPPSWGFRFRPKAYMGALLVEPFRGDKDLKKAIDAGLMLDMLYLYDFNLNVHVGFRAVGAGLGVDIFQNFGLYGGYALSWDGFRSNPEAALWFAFW